MLILRLSKREDQAVIPISTSLKFSVLFSIIWFYFLLADGIFYYLILFSIIWFYFLLADGIFYYLILFSIIWFYVLLADGIFYYLILFYFLLSNLFSNIEAHFLFLSIS